MFRNKSKMTNGFLSPNYRGAKQNETISVAFRVNERQKDNGSGLLHP